MQQTQSKLTFEQAVQLIDQRKSVESQKDPSKTTARQRMLKLKLYAFFKQATTGDITTERPFFWDPVGQYKWDEWNGIKGMSSEDAQSNYIITVNTILNENL